MELCQNCDLILVLQKKDEKKFATQFQGDEISKLMELSEEKIFRIIPQIVKFNNQIQEEILTEIVRQILDLNNLSFSKLLVLFNYSEIIKSPEIDRLMKLIESKENELKFLKTLITKWKNDQINKTIMNQKLLIDEMKKNFTQMKKEIADQTNLINLKEMFNIKFISDGRCISDPKFTKLHFAAVINSLPIGKLLIDNGADIDAKTIDNQKK